MNRQVAAKHLISAWTKATAPPLLGLGLLAISLTALLPAVAQAATFDIANGDVAGLIAAINTANGNGQANSINLATNGTYTLTTIDNSGYYGPTGLPVIISQIAINGNGATIQRSNASGTPDFRIFLISNGPSRLTLNGVTIGGGQGGGFSGAGLLNTGYLLLSNSTVTQNIGVNGDGGGIFNYCGTLTVLNSTISHNTSLSGYGGGGILNLSSYCLATTTIINSTIFENRAAAPSGFQGRGDAIADAFSPAGSVVLKNSIVASPTQGLGSACYAGLWASLGNNIAGDASCGFTGSGDLNSTNPMLGPLANNGGPTQTHAPLYSSLAIDAVPLADCTDDKGSPVATDQRGISRPQGANCDIGSVEVVPTSLGAASGIKSGSLGARVWSFTITNTGPAAASAAQIASFTLAQSGGPACTSPPVVTGAGVNGGPNQAFPNVPLGNMTAASSIPVTITIDFSQCLGARFMTTMVLSANGGATMATVPRYNQFP
jgi:hypothetical protein